MRNSIFASLYVITALTGACAGELTQPPGEPYRVWLFPEPREQVLSDIGMHVQGVTFEALFRAINVADYGRDAENVNAYDEVADSEWFVNRIERHPMTPGEAARGPNRDGPDRAKPWEVLSIKAEGGTPGLLIKDGRGDRYFLKFDLKEHPELWTAAEIIGTRIVWAAGYHTPENHLVFFHDDILTIGPKAMGRGPRGQKRPLTKDDLAAFLDNVGRTKDGLIRAVASRFLDGKPKGPFQFVGTRPDDPNDRVDHRHRRELRGLSVIFALINNTDWKEINTLDMYVPVGDAGYLKHYLLDFNQSLGAGNQGVKEIWGGHEYFVDFKGIGWSHLTLGAVDRAWEKAKQSSYPAVGTFEAEAFDGRQWLPWRAVPPLLYFTDRDGFWAAKIVASFTDAHLAAIVRQARYSDPEAEAYVVKTLQQRRDKIARFWFGEFTPLRRFRLSGQELIFEDLMLVAKHASSEQARYRYHFGDGSWEETNVAQLPLPNQPALEITIQSRYDDKQRWHRPLSVRIKATPSGGRRICAIRR